MGIQGIIKNIHAHRLVVDGLVTAPPILVVITPISLVRTGDIYDTGRRAHTEHTA
jgi:hypothetical protein